MTKKLAAFLLPAIASAQIVCSLGRGYFYYASGEQRPSADALELTNRANSATKTICQSNCPQVVLYRNASASVLMLSIDTERRAKIVYSPQALAGAYDKFGDAGIVALIAHALGHTLDDTLGANWVEKSWNAELRADGWGGCILARSNLTPVEGSDALAALAEFPAPSHPAWSTRLNAIRTGYRNCGGSGPLNEKR